MRILREREVWASTKRTGQNGVDRLQPDEEANVRGALAILLKQYGPCRKLAKRLGVNYSSLYNMAHGRKRPSAGMALRASRLASVGVEEILSGSFSAELCPHCGRK